MKYFDGCYLQNAWDILEALRNAKDTCHTSDRGVIQDMIEELEDICLEYGICPMCGENLTYSHTVDDCGDWTTAKCESCGYTRKEDE